MVASGLADECEVQLSYTIGLPRPVSVGVETFGSGKIPDEQIVAIVERSFDFRPASVIADFNLRFLPSLSKGGFYRRLAAYGQVGRTDLELPWEKFDKASGLK